MCDSEPLEGIECCCIILSDNKTIAPYYQTDLIGHLNNIFVHQIIIEMCTSLKLGLVVCKIAKKFNIFQIDCEVFFLNFYDIRKLLFKKLLIKNIKRRITRRITKFCLDVTSLILAAILTSVIKLNNELLLTIFKYILAVRL